MFGFDNPGSLVGQNQVGVPVGEVLQTFRVLPELADKVQPLREGAPVELECFRTALEHFEDVAERGPVAVVVCEPVIPAEAAEGYDVAFIHSNTSPTVMSSAVIFIFP